MSELNREEIQNEITRLKEEHAKLDANVLELEAQVWLSPEDQVTLKENKKLKLKTKEQISELEKKLADN